MIQYKPRKGLLGLVLASSLIGGGCFLGDIAVGMLDEGANQESNPLARGAISGFSNGVKKSSQRGENTRVKYEDAKVDIYRQREESKIRIEEERAMQNIYNEENSEANETIRQVLEKNITQKVMNAVLKEYKKHPFDWERNVKMIANAYKLEDLTSGDKSTLQELLEIACGCTQVLHLKLLSRIYNKNDLINIKRYWKVSGRRHMQDTDGIINLYEFMINHPDTNPRHRNYLVFRAYPKRIRMKLAKLSNQNAIDLLRTKIELFEGIKDNVSLSPKESKCILSSLNRLEGMLRSRLAKTDPEFKEKEKEVLDTIKKAKTTSEEAEILTQASTIELAKEVGHFTQPKRITNKIAPELKTQPKEPELTEAEEAEPELTEAEEAEPELTEAEIPNEKSSTGYWLIPFLIALGAGGGISYKYRNPIYEKYKTFYKKNKKASSKK